RALECSFGQVQYATIARPRGISFMCAAASSGGTRTEPGIWVPALLQASALRASTNTICSPLSRRARTSSTVTRETSMAQPPSGRPDPRTDDSDRLHVLHEACRDGGRGERLQGGHYRKAFASAARRLGMLARGSR